eukprot:6694216-Alexandrium_andersonii.AAC.1
MSASLVGSEMCIRDRVLAAARRTEVRRPCPHGPLATAPRRCPSRCPGPVSYTHLTLPTICSV